jgi:CDP-glucose 4,6-dehydratase
VGGVGAVTDGAGVSTSSWVGARVLVTGATGMVGSWLTRRLVDLGANVAALVLDADPRTELYRSGTVHSVSVVSGCLEDLTVVERGIVRHEVDTVFHLGAQTIVSAARRSPLATFETNVRGTWNVLEACRRHSDLVRRIVIASSDKAYGEATELPYREDMPLNGRQPYEASKACADLVTQSFAVTFGLPVATARFANIFGGGDLNWSRIVPGTIRSLLRSEQPVIRSDGTFRRDYVFVGDVVEAYLLVADALLEADLAGEVFNFSDESPLTVMEMYEAICTAAGFPGTEPLVLNDAPGEIRDQHLSAKKAAAVLGWSPRVTLHEGLGRTADWYRDYLGVRSGAGAAHAEPR